MLQHVHPRGAEGRVLQLSLSLIRAGGQLSIAALIRCC